MNKETKNTDKKAIVIGSVALSLMLAVIIFLVVFFALSKGKNGDGNTESTPAETTMAEELKTEPEFDTFVMGSGADDPQNTDDSLLSGEELNISDISRVTGRMLTVSVNSWQGEIDWDSVKASGVDAAYIRIGYRSEDGTIYRDSMADSYIDGAEKAGLLVGVYFYSSAVDETEAAEEARWTVEAVEGYPVSCPVVYYCDGFREAGSRTYFVSRSVRTASALSFMNTVKDCGYSAMLYTSADSLSDGAYWSTSELDGTFRVWVGEFTENTYRNNAYPAYSDDVDGWHYTMRGTVSGIDGMTDLSVLYFKSKASEARDPEKRPSADISVLEGEFSDANELVTPLESSNLRTRPSGKSDIVKVLKNGESVTRTAIYENGWSRLECDGEVLYAVTDTLTTNIYYNPSGNTGREIINGQTFFAREDMVTAKNVVNLRAEPTTDSEIIATLERGDYLLRTGLGDKGWSQLSYNGQVVYAVTNYITLEEISVEADE